MKLWKWLTMLLVIALLGACLLSCGDTGADTTDGDTGDTDVTDTDTTDGESVGPDETGEGTTPPETTEPETTAFVCEHPNLKVTGVEPTCEAGGYSETKCEDCGFMEHTDLAPKHNDTETYTSENGIAECVCTECGDRSMVIAAGKKLKLSAYCEGELGFSLVGAPQNQSCELIVDNKTVGAAVFTDGHATLTASELALGAHSITLLNKGSCPLRVKTEKIDGHFNRMGAILLELEGRKGQDFGTFNIFVQTNDPSGDYYIRYPMRYEYRLDTDVFQASKVLTNVKNFRIYGAQLVKVTEVGDYKVQYEQLKGVLSVGEISLAMRQQNAYESELAEGAKAVLSSPVLDFIGGYHGDEWIESVSLFADGEEILLGKAGLTVIPCNTLIFDQTTTMYAWGTCTSESRGAPVAKHIQKFVFDSTGVDQRQTVEWLRGDFEINAAYMPMFTMCRGPLEARYIDTMRSYDKDGNLIEEYVMPNVGVEAQYGVLSSGEPAAYEYLGSAGLSAKVSFRAANDEVKLGAYVAIRTEVQNDNKLYVGVSSVKNGKTPAESEIWIVESHSMIDYIEPIA